MTVNHIAITVDGSFVLIEHFALLIAYGCSNVRHQVLPIADGNYIQLDPNKTFL